MQLPSDVGEIMKLNRRKTRRLTPDTQYAPAEVETLESRQLLTTTPSLLTPGAGEVVVDPTPEITWEAVDNAVSYDVWVTSLTSFETLFVERGVVGTSYTVPEGRLALEGIRVWVNATLSDGSTSGWSDSHDFFYKAAPSITGPVGVGANNLTFNPNPEITFDTPSQATRYQLWVTDLTKRAAAEAAAGNDPVDVSAHSTVYNFFNQTPRLDEDGSQLTDASGNLLYDEVRSFVIPEDANSNADSDPLDLPITRMRVWLRAFDENGNATAWSSGFTFDVGPKPQDLGPNAPTFQKSPQLLFDAVDGATHYDVYLAKDGQAGPFFRRVVARTNDISEAIRIATSEAGTPIVHGDLDDPDTRSETPRLDEVGNEVPYNILPTNPASSFTYWVRGISNPENGPVVYGAWSDPARFETLTAPVFTSPVESVLTAARPILEWSVIDGAAEYQLRVHKFNSRPPFLDVNVNGTSYQLSNIVERGEYTAWVRPISTRGEFGPWSEPKTFTATGGRPIITVPNPGDVQLFPRFEWQAVPDSNVSGYEIWVSHVGVDFTFINSSVASDVTSFAGNDPLNTGNYRVWVRALFADGTSGPWSDPVDFAGGFAANESSNSDADDTGLEILTASISDHSPTADAKADVGKAAEVAVAYVHEPERQPEHAQLPVKHAAAPVQALPDDLLRQIAAECVDGAWWEQAS